MRCWWGSPIQALEEGCREGRGRGMSRGEAGRNAMTGEGGLSQTEGGPRWMGEWDDGVIFFWWGGGTLKVISERLVDELEETEHLSLGAKGDSGMGSRGVAWPSRLAAGPLLLQPACTTTPGRPWCLPAPGSRQGSVHGLHQGATVQGSSCGPPAHSGTMERHFGVSRGEIGGIGTGAGEALWGEGGLGRRGCGYSLGCLGSPKALGQRSASGVCVWEAAGPGAQDTKDGARASPYWGPKPPC